MPSYNKHIIFLTGYMGAGKSTVGKIVSDRIHYVFVDLDAEIVRQEGRSITDIFAEEGEQYFRERESEVLKTLDDSSFVVATGGGIVLRDTNRAYMRTRGTVVYLRATWPVIKSRLLDSTDRPLVDPTKGWESVEARWLERQQFYEDADFVIDTDNLSPEQCAQEIIKVAGF